MGPGFLWRAPHAKGQVKTMNVASAVYWIYLKCVLSALTDNQIPNNIKMVEVIWWLYKTDKRYSSWFSFMFCFWKVQYHMAQLRKSKTQRSLVPISRGQPRAFWQGEVLRHFLDFRELFWSIFWISFTFLTLKLLLQLKIGRSQPV